jgi:D-methionine transport system substrate-binding protein
VHGGIGRQQKACHRPDKAADYKIISVGNTYIPPIAFYSKKYKSLEALPVGATISILDDPSNQTRDLVILRDHKIITLRDGFDPCTGTATLRKTLCQ